MFTKQDELLHKGLMKLLDEATFHLEAREVKSFLVIYEWAKQLPDNQRTDTIIQKKKEKSDGSK